MGYQKRVSWDSNITGQHQDDKLTNTSCSNNLNIRNTLNHDERLKSTGFKQRRGRNSVMITLASDKKYIIKPLIPITKPVLQGKKKTEQPIIKL